MKPPIIRFVNFLKSTGLFRNIMGAALFFGCQLTAGDAQQQPDTYPDTYVADLWQVYVTRCGLALENPQNFLNSLPPTNTRGGPNAVLTNDQILLVSSTSQNGFTVDADIIAQSGGLNISCHVFPSTNRIFELENFAAVTIENALRQFLVSQGLREPSGGEIKTAFTGPQEGDEISYEYVVETVLSGRPALTRLEMAEGYLAVYFAGLFVPASR